MYKTTSKSMQKATGRDIPRKTPVLRHPNARIIKDELPDFDTAQKPRQALLDELRPVMRRLGNQERPGLLAKLLNAERWRTSQGRKWNERRVILLLRFLNSNTKRARSPKTLPPLKKIGPRSTPGTKAPSSS